MSKKVLRLEIDERQKIKCSQYAVPVGKQGAPKEKAAHLKAQLIALDGGSPVVKRLSGYSAEQQSKL